MRWVGAVVLYAVLGGVLYVADTWGQRRGTTFIGAPYTTNENVNNAIKAIDDVMCGGLPPLAPCQLPPTASLHVLGNLQVDGATSYTNLTVPGTLTAGTVNATNSSTQSATVTGGLVLNNAQALIEQGTLAVYNHVGDANETFSVAQTGLVSYGPGGATIPDVTMTYDNSSGVGAFRMQRLKISGKFMSDAGVNFITKGSNCTTAASVGATCTDTVAWSSTLAASSYTSLCTCTQSSGLPTLYVTGKSQTQLTVTTVAITAVAAHCSEISCMAAVN